MSIDRKTLTKNQQTIYDMWVNIRKEDPDDPELERLLVIAGMPKSRVRAVSAERQEVLRREAELVYKHLYNKKEPITTICKNCEEPFVTDYEYAKHCSDECLRRSLERMGLAWHPEKTPQERWNAVQPPSIIEPASVKTIWPCIAEDENLDFSVFAPEPEKDVVVGHLFEKDPFAEFF